MGIFPGFEFWTALLMGIAVPEAVAMAANQKRGQGLRIVAMAAIVFGFVLSRVVFNAFPFLLHFNGLNVPSPGGISWLDSLPFAFYVTQYTILWLAMALILAYQRLR
jgi:hypothetical protein